MAKKSTYGQALMIGVGLIAFSQLLIRPVFADSNNLMVAGLTILFEFIGIYLTILGFYRWHTETTNKKSSSTDNNTTEIEENK